MNMTFWGKVASVALIWGKPLIRKALKTYLMPMVVRAIKRGAGNAEKVSERLMDTFIEKYL